MSSLREYIKGQRVFVAAGILVVLAGGVFAYKNATATSGDIQIATAKVTKSDLRIAFSVDGKLTIDTYEPGFSVAGKITKVLVKEGDTVKRGQWLATIDAREAQKNVEKSLRDYSKERNDFDQDLQVTYFDKEMTDTFKRILEKNQWDLDKAVLDVELKDLALQQSRVTSPVDGVIAEIYVKEGDVVGTQNQTPVLTIVKPNTFSFEAYAEEEDALKITDTQTTSITLDAYDKEQLPAKLSFVSPLATTDSNGLSSYKVTATLENPDDLKLMDGMEGSISFVTKEIKGVIVVPNKAVKRDGSQAYVNVLQADNSAQRTDIETGFTDGKSVEVINGLTPGQEVVLN